MRFYPAVLVVAIAVSPITLAAKTTTQWKPCSQYTVTSETPASSGSGNDGPNAECAIYNAPLCYPGLCETPEGANSTIEVFVKRYPATSNPKTARNVWLLQGGPGSSSVSLETTTVDLQAKLGGAVNMYLMDHRGTGRSTRLSCAAGSSPSGEVDEQNVGKCAQELISKYGDMASFSTTSAARDIATFMSEYTNGEDTIVYGMSYGTMLGERLIHLDPPEVTGYVGDRFLAMSQKDREIAARFKKTGLAGTIKHLITKFDKHPKSRCSLIVKALNNDTDTGASNATETEPASFTLRRALGMMLFDSEIRKLLPPVVYRLNRCADKDLVILSRIIQVLRDTLSGKDEAVSYDVGNQGVNVIMFSEMWQMPSPSVETLKKRFTNVLMSNAGMYALTELYCAYTKEKSTTCSQFQTGKYDANPIIYDRDEYWNKGAVIPTQASVLLLSGKLDGQTTHKYAELLLDALQGDNKELVSFDHATHGTIVSTPLIPDDPESPICGMELLVS
eukprot:jgi/Phyca11/109368/e_gw1.16.267.1